MSAALLRRRALLGGAGLLAIGFAAGCAIPVIPKRPGADLASASGWIEYRDGRYRLRLPRVEMGQGASLGLRQIAAEALGIALLDLQLLPLDTGAMARVRATVGSESIKDFGPPLQQACRLLREAVAAGRSQAQLRDVAPRLMRLRGDGRLVGQALRQPEDIELLRGAPLFVADLQRPGLLYGRVLRAPASPLLASRCIGLDEAAARADPGFVALLRDPRLVLAQSEGLGLVARTPGALARIAERLAPRWQVEGRCDDASLAHALALDGRPQHRLLDEGGLDEDGRWDVDIELEIPPAAHAAIEPRAALAEPDGQGGLRLWVGSQDPFYVRDHLADLLRLAPERLQVQAMRIGGGFGGRSMVNVEQEAALLALAVQAPVRVQWTRAQEFQQGFHRPPSRHRLRARVRDGRLQAWWHRFASGPVIFSNAAMPPWLQRLASHAVVDRGVARGALLPYRAPQRRIAFDSVDLPLPCGPWRGLGAGPNGLLVETGIDECARRAGGDPLQFRIDHAEPPRLRRVLQALAPHWASPLPPAEPGWRSGRGIACGVYKESSYVAVLAELQIESASGALRVTRMLCVHDCGEVVNPDRVRAQCEGNLVWGLGMVLCEGLAMGEQGVAAAQFADAPIPRLNEMPELHIELLDHGEAPGGAGETAIVAAGAAVLNALRDASGWRPRRLPLASAELREALRP